jgi:hypothetical protein
MAGGGGIVGTYAAQSNVSTSHFAKRASAGANNCVVMTSKTCAYAVFVNPGIVHLLRAESGSAHLLFPQ